MKTFFTQLVKTFLVGLNPVFKHNVLNLKLQSIYLLILQVPSRLQESFLSWKERRSPPQTTPSSCNEDSSCDLHMIGSVSFFRLPPQNVSLRAARQGLGRHSRRRTSQLHSLSRVLCVNSQTNLKEQRPRSQNWLHAAPERDSDKILSLHIPVFCTEICTNIK